MNFSVTIIWENKRGKKWKKSGIERESRRGANHDDHQAFAFDEGQRRRRGGGAQPVEV